MRRFLLVFSLFYGLSLSLSGQLDPAITELPPCGVATAAFDSGTDTNPNNTNWGSVVLSEVMIDAGQSDSRNDAFVEIAGIAGTNIGGWVITNGEWAVVLPQGTVIPTDGYYVVACAENLSESTFGTATSGIACADCDFAGLPIDFDVCSAANAVYVSTSVTTYGFTFDNGYCGESADGDQCLLFRPDGTPHDGIFWGLADEIGDNVANGMTQGGGASGACGSPSDHISVQDGSYYMLGDNDENGTPNDVIQSRVGRRADAGDATGVKQMPIGDYDPDANGLTNVDEGVCFVMPPFTDGVWVNPGTAATSCNSSYMRVNGSNGSHGVRGWAANPSHMDDPDLDTDWTDIVLGSHVPASSGNAAAAAQWGYSDHPNPGVANASDSWDFSVNGSEITSATAGYNGASRTYTITQCPAEALSFSLSVYNFQHVEPLQESTSTVYSVTPSLKAGSFVIDQTGAVNDWTTTQLGSAGTGTTTMTFSAGTLPAGMHEFILVWDDFTALGSGKVSTVSGRAGTANQHECYEDLIIIVNVIEPLALNCGGEVPCNIDCSAGDGSAGTLNLGNLVTGGGSVIFELFDGGVSQGTSNTGVFELPSTLTGPLTATATSLESCGAPVSFTIESNCIADPPCPVVTASNFLLDGAACTGPTSTILTQSFDGTTGYTQTGVFSDGGDDYFDLIGVGADPTGVPAYSGFSGSYWAAEDNQNSDATDPNPNVNESYIDITGVDISSCSSVSISGLFAAGSSSAYDASDYMHVYAAVDGGAMTLVGAFEGTGAGASNTTLSQDTDLDGVGDGTVLTTTAGGFTFPIAATGNTLDIRVEVFMTSGSETVAFDEIEVNCSSGSGGCELCPGQTLTFQVSAGVNLPNGGTIDWYFNSASSTTVGEVADGTYIGSGTITATQPTVPTNTTPVVNEVLYNPINNDGTAGENGEWVELAAVPGTDLSGYILCDPDWCIQFPAGTTVPASGYLVIGYAGFAEGATVNLDIASLPAANIGGTPMTLGNTTELIALLDPSTAFVDGVEWGTETDLTAPLPSSAGGGTVTFPALTSFDPSTSTNDGVSVERIPDATDGDNFQDSDSVAGSYDFNTPGGMNDFETIVSVTDVVWTVPSCGDTPMPPSGNVFVAGVVSPVPSACPASPLDPVTDEFALSIGECPDADLVSLSVDQCTGDGAVPVQVNLTGLTTGNYLVTYTDVDGTTQTLSVPAPASNPVTLTTISDAAAVSGTITLVSVHKETSGNTASDVTGECTGTVDSDEVVIEIGDAPDGSLATLTPTSITGCSPTVGGSVEINFGAGATGPFEYEYTDPAGNSVIATSATNPAMVSVSEPGTITLNTIATVGGCAATSTASTLVETDQTFPAATIAQAVDCATAEGKVTLNITAGTGPFTISGAINDTGVAAGTTDYTGLTGGGTVTIASDDGCETEVTFSFDDTNCPVPVELVNFFAIKNGDQVDLNWITASERNNAYFNVEHSLDGRDFETLGKVRGAGTTSDRTNYSYEHKRPSNGINYYRLKQVDNDGSFEYSDIKTVSFSYDRKFIRIIPSIALNEVTIEFNEAITNKASLEVFDVIGQAVISKNLAEGTNEVELNITDLAYGHYFVRVKSNGTILTNRFIKR